MVKKIIFAIWLTFSTFHLFAQDQTPAISEKIVEPTMQEQLFQVLEADNIRAVTHLLTEHGKPHSFYYQEFGTPLFFAKSLPMAQLLMTHDFDPLVCDAHGFTASEGITATKDCRFVSPQEKAAIIALYKSKELGRSAQKTLYQLRYNHRYRALLPLTAVTAFWSWGIISIVAVLCNRKLS